MKVIIDDETSFNISKEACCLMERFHLPFLFNSDESHLFDFRDISSIVNISRETMGLLIEYLEGHTDPSSYYPDLSVEDPVFCEFDKKYFSQFDRYIYSTESKYGYIFTDTAKEYIDKWIDLYLLMMRGYFDSVDHPFVESLAFKIASLNYATNEEMESLFGKESDETKIIIEEYSEEQIRKISVYLAE